LSASLLLVLNQAQLAEQDAALTQSARDKLVLMEELSAAEQKVDVLQVHANDLKIRLAQATEVGCA
jgi:hypothetical protein